MISKLMWKLISRRAHKKYIFIPIDIAHNTNGGGASTHYQLFLIREQQVYLTMNLFKFT